VTAAARLPAPASALDALFDAALTAARAGHAPKLTFHGSTQHAALRAWAERNGLRIASDRMTGTLHRNAVQWWCDEVELPVRGSIIAHSDDERIPMLEGVQ
jgi:hypothetical protein